MINIAEESAIIIWDTATRTQHFIRRASFETKAKDFGFLVPTPTVPKLEESDDAAFSFVAWLTRPPVSEDVRVMAKKADKAKAAPAPVTVIATAKVAGYDAAVLEATDANALDLWLKEHGYHSSPELRDWFKPYIEQKWKITAFKIARDNADAGKVNASAVRMSFQTEQPFFPYREPAAAPSRTDKSRTLRIFLLADARYKGRIGLGSGDTWPGRPVWSNKIADGNRVRLLRELKMPDTFAGASHLTEFVDNSSPRPGKDELYLSRAADQSVLEKPPFDPSFEEPNLFWVLVVYLLFPAAAIVLAIWLVRKVRRGPTSARP